MADLLSPTEPVYPDQQFTVTVEGGSTQGFQKPYSVFINDTLVHREDRTAGGRSNITIETEPLPAPETLDFVAVGSTNGVYFEPPGADPQYAGTFYVHNPDEAPAREIATVEAVTANQTTIDSGNLVNVTAIHRSHLDEQAVAADLVVDREYEDGTIETLHVDRISSPPRLSEEIVPVQLDDPGEANLCAYLTNRERIPTQ